MKKKENLNYLCVCLRTINYVRFKKRTIIGLSNPLFCTYVVILYSPPNGKFSAAG